MTVDETKILLARIAEFWPGRSSTITAATVEAWAHLFADTSFDAALAALDGYCDDETMNRHPPAGPVLRARAKNLAPKHYRTIWDDDGGGFHVAPGARVLPRVESIGAAPESDEPPAAGDPVGVVRELSARLRADDRPQEKETP